MNITEKLNHLREGFVVGHLWTHDLLGQIDKFDALNIPEYRAKAGEIIYLFNAVGDLLETAQTRHVLLFQGRENIAILQSAIQTLTQRANTVLADELNYQIIR